MADNPLDEARRRAQQFGAPATPRVVPPQATAPPRTANPPASGAVAAVRPPGGGYNSPANRRAVVDMQNRTGELAQRGNAADAARRQAAGYSSGGGRGPSGGGGRDGAPAPQNNGSGFRPLTSVREGVTGTVKPFAAPASRRPPFNPNWQDPSKPSNVPRQINWNPAAKDVPSLAGTWNGRQITRNEADELASKVNTVPAAAFGQGAQRRGGNAPMGYQGQGRRTSKGPSVDDKYQLQRDLMSLGRGSPTIRAALMGRYNDQANNAERGTNDMAVTDLQATARGQENFADRTQAQGMFDEEFGLKQTESGARVNILDEMRKSAAASREDDKYGLGRRGLQDKDSNARIDQRVAEYVQAGAAPEEARRRAQADIARETVSTGQDLQGTGEVLGAQDTAQALLDEIASNPAGRASGLFESGDRILGGNAAAPSQADYDLNNIDIKPREMPFSGLDFDTLNYVLPKSLEFDAYAMEGKTDDPGARFRKTFSADQLTAEQRKLRDARAAQAALRRRNEQSR